MDNKNSKIYSKEHRERRKKRFGAGADISKSRKYVKKVGSDREGDIEDVNRRGGGQRHIDRGLVDAISRRQPIQNTYPIKSSLMNVMVTAALRAGRGIMRDFGELSNLQVSKKGAVNFVSCADLRAEQVIHKELSKARPKYGFLMEERGEINGSDSEYRWVVDPLDGTTNFLHAIPYFAISIAVEKRVGNGKSEIISALVYDPVHDEMFMAEKGVGAYANNTKIRVTSREEDFYFVTGTARMKSDYQQRSSDITKYTMTFPSVLRRSGAAALDLAYVAAGRYDACWFPHLQKWDMAAGILLVEEAGGVINRLGEAGTYEAYESGAILAASPISAEILAKAVKAKK